MVRPDKTLDEVQHLFAGGWCSSGIWTLIQCVQDNENWKLSREFEHLFKTFREGGNTGLFGAITACGEQVIKNIPATVRVVSQLKEKRRQQAADIPLGSIFKVKVIPRDQGRTGLSHVLDVFDNSGTYCRYKFPLIKRDEKDTYQRMLFPAPAVKSGKGSIVGGKNDGRSVRLPWTHNKEPFFFQSRNVSLWTNHLAVPSC